ncbi:MAG: tetratricopeptide repeat protein [Alphaproteobacteria bacterium]|nr:tetratricopeptide repeat protein [Alphaproteobacteria bacterium]MCB9690752.1 tetratricopeptide repeat protein [Alphaproteobacteria bacterium]
MSRLEHYRTWLEGRPTDRMALYGVAFELKKAGRVDEAREAFEALLALHPDSGAGWFQYGQLLEEDGDEDGAVAVWRRGLEALGDDPAGERSRGEISAALAALE